MGRCDMVSLSQRDRTSHVMSAHSSHEARAILQRYVNETRGGHPFNNDLSKLTQRREEACDCSREPACTVRESTSQSDPHTRETLRLWSPGCLDSTLGVRSFLRKVISAEAGLPSALSRFVLRFP